MKKILAFVLAMMMLLSAVCFADAETTADTTADDLQTLIDLENEGYAVYLTVGVIDAEGNVTWIDGTEESDTLFILDTNNGAFGFGTYVYGDDETVLPDNYVTGTCEVTDETDGMQTLTCTYEDGTSFTISYDVETDSFIYVDESNAENPAVYLLTRLISLAEAASTIEALYDE